MCEPGRFLQGHRTSVDSADFGSDFGDDSEGSELDLFEDRERMSRVLLPCFVGGVMAETLLC